MVVCASSDESDLDADEPLWVETGTNTSTRHSNQSYRGRGRGRLLPERVRRSLNPTLFRNVEYDVWHKSKRAQQKKDYCIAAGMQYTVGDRCQVRLDGRSYSATIKEVPPNNNRVVVYIEELGNRNVPLWNLRPLSDESSWSTVVNKDKRLSNGYGDWEERGKGRGRGKSSQSSSSSSSASQATAPGSSGRVLKQHSWPPQATVEEQGGAKTNRKSVSSAEQALFGLTEEERLAKEEEERNVALVEIQLRDEHSFPALGAQTGPQGDGGKRKGGEKRRSQRNKTKSPVEDIRAASPSAGETPKSSTPPPATTTATTAPSTNTTTPTNPTLPAAKPAASPPANSSRSLKASTAAASGSVSTLPPTCAAPTAKSNTQSYASAAGAAPTASPPPPPLPPAAAPSSKPSVTGGALPHSVPSSATVFSFLTPALPAASSPATPPTLSSSSPPPSSSSKLPTSSSSSLPAKSSASPPPPSSVPPPTFIAPIAPSPVAAQGFLPPSSLPRSSPPVPSLPHSPSPPSSSASSSSLIHHAAQVKEPPPAPAQTPSSLSSGGSMTSQAFQTQTSVSLPQNQSQISVAQTQTPVSLTPAQPSLPSAQTQSQASLPQSQILMPQMQTEAQASLPQVQASVSHPHPQPQSQAQYPSQSQSEMVQVQSSQPPPGVSSPHTAPASVPVSAPAQPPPSVTHAHLHSQPAQPPPPSQLPHPSLPMPAPLTHPYLHSHTPSTQNQTEASPAQHPPPQSESPAHPPSQQSHPPHPQLLSAHPPPPPHPQSIPGAVPLQKLSQLYQDPLYPGFPQGEKGDIVPTPPFSSSKSGDDLPQDVNILRFFFNLGLKAYSMPLFAPYMYLLPLQQAHTINHRLPSRSSSPTTHFPPSSAPTSHPELYPQYPPSSLPQYDHQAPLAEPPRPSEPSFNQAGYPVTQPPPHRMPCTSLPWQQHQIPPPRNSNYPVGYPTATPPYPVPSPSSQGYHSGQSPGHPLYPQPMPPYPPSSLGYQSASTPEDLHVSQGLMEQLQPVNGDTMHGHGPGRVPGPLEGPAAANMANANNNRTMVVNSFVMKKTQGESSTKAVLLVDPPLNNRPIVALVSNSDSSDVPVSMMTMKPSSTPGSPYSVISKTTVSSDNTYRLHPKSFNPNKPYVAVGAPEPGKMGHLPMTEALSVGCSTEDDWEEVEGFKPPTQSFRGSRRGYRGGRWRGGNRRRQGGEAGVGVNHGPYVSSHRGRGW
ncbi:OTU domain-containing protein 4 isoform X2 [Trachinotus anak]